MWSRVELKTQAKNLLKLNYWLFVLGGIILSFVTTGHISGSGGLKLNYNANSKNIYDISNSIGDAFSSDQKDITYDFKDSINEITGSITPSIAKTIIAVVIGSIVIALVAALIGIALSVFVFNPIQVGAKRFFSRSYEARCDMGEISYGFKSNYLNIVKIMFFRSLFTVLWGLLFIIPGIIKAYEYSMIPYLLSENPAMDMQQAFDESRRMTYGQKWQIFVLDLSFIGWNILSSFTLGLLGIFFVSPYMCLTKAGLYRRLRGYNDYKY